MKLTKFNKLYYEIMKRSISHGVPNLKTFIENKITLSDVICESCLPSPNLLVKNILNKIDKNDEVFFSYKYDDILKLIDKNWKFYYNFLKLEDFQLTILKCNYEDVQKNVGFNPQIQGDACEFFDGKNWKHEYIWFDKNYRCSQNDKLKLIKHELGHVWTSVFGFDDDDFYVGRTSFMNNSRIPNLENFSNFQKEIFISLYNKNFDSFKKDFEYIFKNSSGNDSNWELSTHIDEIIELLIDDYFEKYQYLSTSQYLNMLFSKINSKENVQFSNLNILNHYKYEIGYSNEDNITYMKNIIRRLFLIFGFGNEETLDYFYKECEKEFGNETSKI